MSVTATGFESGPMATLRTAISQSSTFQTWVSAASAADALARVYEISETDYTLPCAVLDQGDITSESIAVGVMERRGTLHVRLFSGAVSATQTAGDQFRTFANTAAAIIADVENQAGTGGLNITAMRRGELYQRPYAEAAQTDGDGDIYAARYDLDYMGA